MLERSITQKEGGRGGRRGGEGGGSMFIEETEGGMAEWSESSSGTCHKLADDVLRVCRASFQHQTNKQA